MDVFIVLLGYIFERVEGLEGLPILKQWEGRVVVLVVRFLLPILMLIPDMFV